MKEYYGDEYYRLSIPNDVEEIPVGGYECGVDGCTMLTGDYKRDVTMLVRVINTLLEKVDDLEYKVDKLYSSDEDSYPGY